MSGQPPWLAKKPGNAAEDKKDGGMDDAQEKTMPMKKGMKKKGSVPPGLKNAIGRKIGVMK